jgi:hypothetical protein
MEFVVIIISDRLSAVIAGSNPFRNSDVFTFLCSSPGKTLRGADPPCRESYRHAEETARVEAKALTWLWH